MNLSVGVRLRLLIALAVLCVSVYFVPPRSSATGCSNCVQLTGGLCVGCDPNQPVFPGCIPNQETCSCDVTPGSCPPGGG